MFWFLQSHWKSSRVTTSCLSPRNAGGLVGVRKDALEDGCPSSMGSAATLMISSQANPDGQHWPLRNLRPRWVDDSIGEMLQGQNTSPSPCHTRRVSRHPKPAIRDMLCLKAGSGEDMQAGWARGATYLGRDEPLDQLPDKGGQVRVLYPALLQQTSL